MHIAVLSICLLLTVSLIDYVESYKYLAVLHTAAKSHFSVGASLMKALAQKGHEVYVISPFPQKQPLDNYHDIPLPSVLKATEGNVRNLLSHNDKSVMQNFIDYYNYGLKITEMVLKEPVVQELLASNHTFDAVICEVFLSEALFGISEHFKAPLIGVSAFGAIAWNTDMVGSPSPPSYVPSAALKFSDHMCLKQRIGNLAFLTFETTFFNLYYLPKQAELYKKYFPNLQRTLNEVRTNAALVLLNTHVSLGYPRPYVPNQIEVGGMQINRQLQPLPEDIEKFIIEAKHGVIYFSMGSNLKSKDLPHEKKEEILKAFKSIKQRVLWKFEDTNLKGKPDNVFISDWFPQNDVLAHDNVRVFITHGGLLGTTESIYHGKPVIGLPIFGDQFLNMVKAETNGYGIMLDYKNLNAKDLTQAIDRIFNDKSFSQRAKVMSERYKDQPMLPTDLAIYWVEHVARHKGAKYLHCAGLDLNFIEYHNIDAMLILYGGIMLTLLAFFYFISLLVKMVRKNILQKSNTKQKKS